MYLIVLISVLLNEARSSCDYNYAFVFDESGSVGKANYDESVDFIIGLIEQGKIAQSAPIQALSFDNNHRFVYGFHQPQSPRQPIIDALIAEKAAYNGGGTSTGQAMAAAIQTFVTAGFTNNNVLMLITDGVGGDPCANLQGIIDNNIRVILIGVGNLNPASNACLVTGNQATDIITIADFNFQPVVELLEKDQIVCTCDKDGEGTPCPNGDECDQFGDCMVCCAGTGLCHLS